jgi:hypothetical protein
MILILKVDRAHQRGDAYVLKQIQSVILVAQQQPNSRKNPSSVFEQHPDTVLMDRGVTVAEQLTPSLPIVGNLLAGR